MSLESELDKLTIPDEENSGPINTNRKDCSYCKKPFTVELWCKKCDPFRMIEGWTSGNPHVDKFIKDTIYNARESGQEPPRLLEWVPFDRFTDVKQIGEGGFAKVYTATWLDGKPEFEELDDGSWRKGRRKPMKKIALKRLNGSQNMSAEFLSELQIFWKYAINCNTLDFYGITKDEEFIMIVDYANEGNYRSILSTRFNNILWRDKIDTLYSTSFGLRKFHKMGFCHKDFHSGNILQHDNASFISDFGLSRPASEQDSSGKIYGVLPYIAPEVLNGEPYTEASDIYSFGIFMAELSSGNPPFYNSRHDLSLALSICEGLRPEFGKGTPEFYKKLAYRCMNAIPSQRPTADELSRIFDFWGNALRPKAYTGVERKFGYNRREVKMAFDQADKEIPNISPSYDPNAIYTSRAFTFNNLSKPVNSSLIKSYIEDNKDSQDSKLINLELE